MDGRYVKGHKSLIKHVSARRQFVGARPTDSKSNKFMSMHWAQGRALAGEHTSAILNFTVKNSLSLKHAFIYFPRKVLLAEVELVIRTMLKPFSKLNKRVSSSTRGYTVSHCRSSPPPLPLEVYKLTFNH